jgi:hypothetical protein
MNLQSKIWWLIPGAGISSGILYALLIHFGFAAPQMIALREGLLFCIISWFGYSLIWVSVRIYPIRAAIVGYALVAGSLIALFSSYSHSTVELLFLHRYASMSGVVESTPLLLMRCCLYFSLLLFFALALALFRRMEEFEKRSALQQDAATLLREAELFKLRQQLQPHFLYNSLNALAALIYTDSEKAADMVFRLSEFLRSSVRQGQSELVPLTEEIEYLRNYLWIESVRFGPRMQVIWTGDDPLPEAKLPPFLLQPLMENAIRYGLYGHRGEVRIELDIRMEDQLLKLSIRNPFDAAMRTPGGTGFGLEGIRRRLYLTYARQDLLRTQDQEGIFEVTVQIPQ